MMDSPECIEKRRGGGTKEESVWAEARVFDKAVSELIEISMMAYRKEIAALSAPDSHKTPKSWLSLMQHEPPRTPAAPLRALREERAESEKRPIPLPFPSVEQLPALCADAHTQTEAPEDTVTVPISVMMEGLTSSIDALVRQVESLTLQLSRAKQERADVRDVSGLSGAPQSHPSYGVSTFHVPSVSGVPPRAPAMRPTFRAPILSGASVHDVAETCRPPMCYRMSDRVIPHEVASATPRPARCPELWIMYPAEDPGCPPLWIRKPYYGESREDASKQ